MFYFYTQYIGYFKLTPKQTYILGIESSCDDTAAAVIKNGRILSNVVATQNIHKEYGGVNLK